MMADDLKLRYAGALVEQLGAQLYPSATATVAELLSNSWDADAQHVWVTIPFASWQPDNQIVVLDDGNGMRRAEARDAYLVVGRKRRVENPQGDKSEGGRKVHGRKGIGKLAAFGTAGILECSTVRVGELTTFRLDYEKIRKLTPGQDYPVEPASDASPPSDPITGTPFSQGTRITLTHLWLKRALSEAQFMRSMARRFAISQHEMQVFINGTPLERFAIDVEFRFPPDALPNENAERQDDWIKEVLPSGKEVKWWIGFTEKPLDDESLQGISVLARGKMCQRPFKFDRAQGTEGQLGQEYLVGEVEADWIDEGLDVEQDLIQSNRDQLQLEDERLGEFLSWGRRRLAWALRERNRLRSEKALQGFEASAKVEELLSDYTGRERNALLRIAQVASRLPEMNQEGIEHLMEQVINARSDVIVRQLMEDIEQQEEPFQERMWGLVHEFGLLDARKTLSIIEARLETIGKLKEAVNRGAREVPNLHEIIRHDAWLLDPRWHLLDDEVDVRSLGIQFEPETEAETGHIMDFIFVLQPAPPAPIDEVVVVEIKRGSYANGSLRRADDMEVHKFHGYVLAAKEYYARNTKPPVVRGLMVAQAYTARADGIRRTLEQAGDPRFEFKTWDRVIEETERMHLGWLSVSKRRAALN